MWTPPNQHQTARLTWRLTPGYWSRQSPDCSNRVKRVGGEIKDLGSKGLSSLTKVLTQRLTAWSAAQPRFRCGRAVWSMGKVRHQIANQIEIRKVEMWMSALECRLILEDMFFLPRWREMLISVLNERVLHLCAVEHSFFSPCANFNLHSLILK